VVITIAQKAGENDQLFGSVTSGDIAAKLEEQKFHIDKKKIVLHDPIKQLGEYDVTIKLHREVSVDIKVNVVKED
jgi:large subunit ribosomal protein L9